MPKIRGGKFIKHIYRGNEISKEYRNVMVFDNRIFPGTILWNTPTVFLPSSYYQNGIPSKIATVVDGTLNLPLPISKLRGGVEIQFSHCLHDWNSYENTWTYPSESSEFGGSDSVRIPVESLQTNSVIQADKSIAYDTFVKQVSDNELSFSTEIASNSTMDYSGGSHASFLVIESVTAY